MGNRHFVYAAVLTLCARGELAHARQTLEGLPVERSDFPPVSKSLGSYPSVQVEPSAGTPDARTSATTRAYHGQSVRGAKEPELKEPVASAEPVSRLAEFPAVHTGTNPDCLEWKGEACTVCGIRSVRNFSVPNRTKTPLLLCRGMKPGPSRVVMVTHAEPALPGPWEVEFGLGYQTSARNECPHQFIASNNPPLKTAYEVGPISIEAEIPPDGTIETLACVGLSSARVGEGGKETGALLKVFKLRIVSE